jgi:Ca-activated chloride channel family protein
MLGAVLGVLLLAGCGGNGLSDTTTGNAAGRTPPSLTPEQQAAMIEAGTLVDLSSTSVPTNPFVTTSIEPQSTFGLDVDTGSYTVGRRAVQSGQRPPAETVRVEEYVNYFTQDYTNPIGSAFGVQIDGGPTPFMAAQPTHRLVRVGVKARDVDAQFRKDASLTFVIDTSGSMAPDNRLGLVKRSLLLLLDQLGPHDTVAIVEFGTDARIVLRPTSAGDRRSISAAIDGLHTTGSTNAEAGLKMAYALADESFKPGQINRVVLASDGGANVGVTDGSALAQEISSHSVKGIQLATFGFGMGDYNDTLMEQLADKGEGFYAYVDDLSEAKRLFTEKLTSTLQTVALDAKAQVTFDASTVTAYRLVGYEKRKLDNSQFRNDGQLGGPKGDGGEIGAGHQVTALYEVDLAPAATSVPSAALGSVIMRWTDPDTKVPTELTQPITMDLLSHTWDTTAPRFRVDAVVAQYAEALRGSPWAASLEDVAVAAKALPAEMQSDPDVREFESLLDQAQHLH